MRRLQIPSLLILLVLFSGNAFADGNKLLQDCQSFLAVFEDSQERMPSLGFAFSAGQCTGYIQGFSDLNTLYGHVQQKTFWCLPDGVNNGQLVRVVMKYLRNHPEELHQSEDLLVFRALSGAFPCND